MGRKERLALTFVCAPTLLPKQAEKLPLKKEGAAFVWYRALEMLDRTQVNTPEGRCENLNAPLPQLSAAN